MWIVRTIDKIDTDDPVEAAQGRPVFELPFFRLKHVACARRLSRAIAEIAKTKEDENSWRT
jgi:hypothetical protein